MLLENFLVRIEHHELAGENLRRPETVLPIDLAAARSGHGGRRLVFRILAGFRIEDADLAVAHDVEMRSALRIGVSVVNPGNLWNREDLALEFLGAGVNLHQRV